MRNKDSFDFSSPSKIEISVYIQSLTVTSYSDIELLKANYDQLPLFCCEIKRLVELLRRQQWLLLKKNEQLKKIWELKCWAWIVANALGTVVEQDKNGIKIIEVFNRNIGKIEDGVRYHQSSQGGSIHTDQISLHNKTGNFDYVLLSCVKEAFLGGETILIKAKDLYKKLSFFPNVISILKKPFLFENRWGAILETPILYGNGNEIEIRYCRPYIESAYKTANQQLSQEQVLALDLVDLILEQGELQTRIILSSGESLITIDDKVLHGRTSFVDMENSANFELNTTFDNLRKRLSYRIWIKEGK